MGASFDPFAQHDFYRVLNAAAVKQLGLGAGHLRIVDVGCGPGQVTQLLLDSAATEAGGVSVFAIDPDSAALEVARRTVRIPAGSTVTFVNAPIEVFLASRECPEVDFATIFNAFHLLPDRRSTLASLQARMRPGAGLAITTAFWSDADVPSGAFFRRWLLRAARELAGSGSRVERRSRRSGDPTPSPLRATRDELLAMATNAGFSVREVSIARAQLPLAAVEDICEFEPFVSGTFPGLPFADARDALLRQVRPLFEEMGLEYVERDWLELYATRAM